ncbi:MAG: 16S rRNA (cytosine(1402)-N(4))-methyltransferase RsmH [Burkholderiales bacterium]|nr:16S rRNA (cytosine(1402)-N(4))-methyltransferase RsmH [Burkholderiales bacterium]
MSRHETVLLDEAVDALNVREGGIYVDCTFGRGGHSGRILSRLGNSGRLIALDRDADAVACGMSIGSPNLVMVHGAFGKLEALLADFGVAGVDGILLDLGVSSPQLDVAERGFSFRFEGPLDMRMDTSCGQTAEEWIGSASEKELAEVIKNYGEERFAKQISRAIVAARSGQRIATTRQLAEIVAKAVRTREPDQNPATRTFQAIRIFINQELEELSLVLPQCLRVLNPGGRLVVISFHSLEDRIVKQFMKGGASSDVLPKKLPVRECELKAPRLRMVGRIVRPSDAEVAANPRARSAVMRVAERTLAQ